MSVAIMNNGAICFSFCVCFVTVETACKIKFLVQFLYFFYLQQNYGLPLSMKYANFHMLLTSYTGKLFVMCDNVSIAFRWSITL